MLWCMDDILVNLYILSNLHITVFTNLHSYHLPHFDSGMGLAMRVTMYLWKHILYIYSCLDLLYSPDFIYIDFSMCSNLACRIFAFVLWCCIVATMYLFTSVSSHVAECVLQNFLLLLQRVSREWRSSQEHRFLSIKWICVIRLNCRKSSKRYRLFSVE